MNGTNKRVNVLRLLTNPELKRELMIRTIIAVQAREGIETTREQAEAAYDAIQREEKEHTA